MTRLELYDAGTPHRVSWRDPKAVLIRVGEEPAGSAAAVR